MSMPLQTKRVVFVSGALLVAAAVYGFARSGGSDLEPVSSVELNRYVGKWYEVARYPNRFQKKCAGDVSATYSIRQDGKISVLNVCRKADGELTEAKGTARVVDRATRAKLKVTFFWPFSGNYWIIGLDPEYRWAVVGEPTRKYLWILAREPHMSDEDYQKAIAIVREKGYDAAKLEKTLQTR
jgi:apolipoprotein D and lipocalin family protein